MKLTRKLISLALAVLMIAALAVSAMAATGGKLVVTGDSDTVYSVYKMFDVSLANESTSDKYTYKITEDWADFAAMEGVSNYFAVKDSYVMLIKNTVSVADAAAIAELARDYAESKSLTALTTVQVGNEVTLAENGYYLLVPNDTSASGVVVVEGGETLEITEKTAAPGKPTISKTVKEDSIGTYGESNTVDVGETINYRVTIYAGEGASKYILHDSTDEHIVLLDSSNISITRDGNTVPASDYTVVTDATQLCEGCDMHIVFHDSLCASLAEDAQIVVNYTGKLISTAETSADHINTAWLTYTEQAVESNKDTVATQTRKITVNKVDQDGKALAGAGFVLRDNINMYYSWDATANEVKWVSDIADATVATSNDEGLVTFYGVDAENFTLVETVVPGGYTGMGETSVSTKTGDVDADTVYITNTLGNPLPETGGMGTTIFYTLGGVLVIAAVLTLFVIKRKNSVA